jgi:hydroxyacylglutathione hydrolase
MKWFSRLAFVCCAALMSVPASAEVEPGTLDVHWNEGAADCNKSPQPALQVHRYNAQTFILRESPCSTFEAPFMYLLIGSTRALLIDTGDVAEPAKVPLAQTVMALLPRSGASKMPLLVVHTHGHLDHRRGDPQFLTLPGVQVVSTDLPHVKQYFGFNHWPDGMAQVELGGRTIDVLPTPGHYPSHVSYYDRNTALFFSGDFFLPGRLIIDDTAQDQASAHRVADFIRDRPVTHVLGGHIELDAHGDTFDFGSTYHPDEHALQLTKQDLLGLPALLTHFNGFYSQDGMFVMMNQWRVLAAELVLVMAVLVAIVVLIWRFVRRRKRGRAALA